jgi:hypothetical protein
MACRNGNSQQRTKLAALATCALVFLLFGVTVSLNAESNQAGSRQAVLHISVVVMPVVQAVNLTQPPRHDGPVAFNLDTTPREKRYEVRTLPPDTTAHSDKQAPAILKTLVIVPE